MKKGRVCVQWGAQTQREPPLSCFQTSEHDSLHFGGWVRESACQSGSLTEEALSASEPLRDFPNQMQLVLLGWRWCPVSKEQPFKPCHECDRVALGGGSFPGATRSCPGTGLCATGSPGYCPLAGAAFRAPRSGPEVLFPLLCPVMSLCLLL